MTTEGRYMRETLAIVAAKAQGDLETADRLFDDLDVLEMVMVAQAATQLVVVVAQLYANAQDITIDDVLQILGRLAVRYDGGDDSPEGGVTNS